MSLLSLGEAQEWVVSRCAALAPVEVPLAEALGLVLASAASAKEAVPPFANTAMDGIAVRAADVMTVPVTLPVSGTVRAGDRGDVALVPGTVMRIMTGAPIPPGADAIVPVEELEDVDGGASIVVKRTASVGDCIRPAGEDLAAGELAFAPGTILGPGHLGVLATIGLATAFAHRRPRVGVMSTGDELVEAPAELEPGQIRDSNRRTLLALVAETGCVPVDLGCIRDDDQLIEAALRAGIADCDALVTSGGVSMGDFDFVKAALRRLADERATDESATGESAADSAEPSSMRWMQIAIKPAKPLAFGVIGGTPVFGLPGNPVSSQVSFELFARPALRAMMGVPAEQRHRSPLAAVAPEGIERRPDGKVHLARVVISVDPSGHLVARAVRGQGSNLLYSMALANGLAIVDDGSGIAPGGHVRVLVLGGLGTASTVEAAFGSGGFGSAGSLALGEDLCC
jgi:molybdopterin molybdotransferase